MISIVDRKQTANGTLKKYVADTYSEMENANDKVAGDIAYCIETKKWYMLSDSLVWTIILNDMSADLTSLWSAINDKQDSLTFDTTPTNGSTNPVTSEGIKAAISSSGVTVDSAMSTTSVNPVQNKVITAYVAPKNHSSSDGTYGVGTATNYGHNKVINDLTHSSFVDGESLSAYQGKVLNDKINTKQDSLTFDTTPTESSTNPVTSEGINSVLATKAPNSHASTGTTYGVGTTANYGHNKVINDLTHSSFVDGESLSAYQGKVLNDRINTKQNTLTFDSTPTNGSSNPVTSEGIKAAISSSGVTVDSAMSTTSINPVQNKVITTYVAPKNHASSGTTYGVGTTANFGHNKVINDLEHSTFANGESLSAYQGYVLANKSNVLPIGFPYIQLKGFDSPSDLGLLGTWTDVTGSYANKYLAAAGDRLAFGTDYGDGLPNISGDFGKVLMTNRYSIYWNGVFAGSSNQTQKYLGDDRGDQHQGQFNLNFNAANSNGIYGAAGFVRPATTVIKIWKRTA